MPGRFLLDTSSIIALLREKTKIPAEAAHAEIYISAVVLGELYFGARRSDRPEHERAAVDTIAAGLTVLNCDAATAETYSILKNGLWRKGRPIPDNDLWIAATAVRHGLTLVSRDRHFESIEELTLTSW